MKHATLINPFEVPAGSEDQFVEHWKEAVYYMRQREGFISTQLHQSFDPEAAFRFLTSRCRSRPSISGRPSAHQSSKSWPGACPSLAIQHSTESSVSEAIAIHRSR